MSTPHNTAQKGEIAKTVIMPGDPLRAKYIAENFLDDYKLVNNVRCAYAYTGTYKGKELTIMASGMGMPSIGIYSYELYKFYDVENIIRIGSCGSYSPDLKLFDIILSEEVYTEGNFALTLNNENCHIALADKDLNDIITTTAKDNDISIVKGNTICSECFDVYMTNIDEFMNRIPKVFNPISCEMEAFALFYVAKFLNKKAACLMSVVDSKYIDKIASTEEREQKLNTMIKLALDSALRIN
ncbi:MAG: purine-nucleoside phosphorylase [Clostridia bacterium]|nr:purine-nucleoside phosphorylase [Clostridia bacterium]